MGKYITYLLFTLMWPAAQLLIFFFRFGNLPLDMVSQSIIFLPLGLLSSLLLLYLIKKSHSGKQRNLVIGGYILMSPVAFICSLMGGLIFSPIVGTTLYGFIPLAIGMTVGYCIGKLLH